GSNWLRTGRNRLAAGRKKKARTGCPPARARTEQTGASAQLQLCEEVVALVVDDDEGGEVFHLDLPDRFHPEFGIFGLLDLLAVVLRQDRRRPADRVEIEAAVFFAGLSHLVAAVPLCAA